MQQIPENMRKLLSAVELSFWCQNEGLILDGSPFSFKNHEYLLGIYQDPAKKKIFKKAAQLGLSTYEILAALWGCKYQYPAGILYLLPTKDDVSDFSKSRFARLIIDNPDTIGSWVTETDMVNLKRIGKSYLYLRGSRTRTALKTIPVDKLIFDEFDEMRPGAGMTTADKMIRFDPITLARERYSHSRFQHEDLISTPTLPDFGIEAEFAKSDQKHWYLRCGACGKDTCLELTFPDCLKRDSHGRIYRACSHCGAEIFPKDGQWVAHFPDKDVSGYYISQLNSIFIDPAVIYEQFKNLEDATPLQRTEFWNSKLGMGYVETQNRISKNQIYGLCESRLMVSAQGGDPGPCIMGVDQGNNLHVVIGKRTGDKTYKILHLDEYKEWEDLDDLMEHFNVWRCVADLLPEKRNVMTFAKRFWGRVFCNYYVKSVKGAIKWDEQKLIVEENRTESLDSSHLLLTKELVSLPRRCDQVEEFTNHCCNVAKRLIEDQETGSKEYLYIKLSGPDHYRHAFNYFALAGVDAPIVHQSPEIESFRERFRPIYPKDDVPLVMTYQ
jgi:hypothetical protein